MNSVSECLRRLFYNISRIDRYPSSLYMSPLPVKICLVSPVPPPYGGMGHWTTALYRYAQTQPSARISLVDISPHWRAIDDLSLWKRIGGGGIQLIRDMIRTIRALTSVRQDVIHLSTSGQLAVIRDFTVGLIAKCFKIPVVYHIHFGRVPQIAVSRNREWQFIVRVIKSVQAVIVLDQVTKDVIKAQLPNANVQIIPNFVNASSVAYSPALEKSTHTAIFIGWMLPTKGVEELIEAWSSIALQGWKLQLIGPGNNKYPEGLIKRFGTIGIELLGELPHKQAMNLLSQADLFVLPSHTEGFPIVVLEAMASRKPIIATRVGAIPEMLDHGKCGVLVEPHDVSGLIQAMSKLMTDKNLRDILAERAFERAIQTYSIEKIFQQYLKMWQDIGITNHDI